MNYTTSYASPEVLEAAIPLRLKLRQILLYHSSQEVYTTLREMLQEDYAFLQNLFAPAVPVQPALQQPQPTVVQAVPLTQIAQHPEVHPEMTTTSRVTSNTRIRVVKRENVEPPSQPLPPPVEEQEEGEPKDQTLHDRKAAIKRDNAEKTLKKYQELVSKGITPKSLLTKENLEKWVKEGLTYTQIARDHVGIDAEEIGLIAKGFGIKSNIAMKRAAIMAAKK